MPGHYDGPKPPKPKPPKPKLSKPKSPWDEQKTGNAAGQPLPGTGKRKGDLGVGWGP